MKLLRIIPSIDPRGGGPMEGARRIDAELIRLGHHVEVVCLDAPELLFNVNYPATVHALGPALFGYRYSSSLVPWIRTHRHRFDAVLVNGLWQYHGFASWRALAGTSTPYFVYVHGMLDPWFKRSYPLKHIKKWLYWPWADYRLLRDAQSVLFTSEEELRQAPESFSLFRANGKVAAYGTQQPLQDVDGLLSSKFLSKHPELRGKRLFLFLSRIHVKKGCDLLIDAFSTVARNNPDLHLIMAGPDQTDLTAVLKRQAHAIGISNRITWTGMLEGDEKWGAFHAAEVFCLPSHQENFGIVVAEALACGKPVLISNKVNIWREIEADGAGIVHEDTSQGTSFALQRWLNLSDDERCAMSQAASSCFVGRFRIDRVVQSLLSIISSAKNTQIEPLGVAQ